MSTSSKSAWERCWGNISLNTYTLSGKKKSGGSFSCSSGHQGNISLNTYALSCHQGNISLNTYTLSGKCIVKKGGGGFSCSSGHQENIPCNNHACLLGICCMESENVSRRLIYAACYSRVSPIPFACYGKKSVISVPYYSTRGSMTWTCPCSSPVQMSN